MIMKLIDKDALVAEIEKLVDKGKYHEEFDCAYRDGNNGALYALKDKLDTLEVKEVDLDFQRFAKEMDAVFALPSSETNNTEEEPLNWEYAIAKHFFELGLSVNNPITASDRGIVDEIIFALNALGKEKMISYDKEIEWLRNKAQKGEEV